MAIAKDCHSQEFGNHRGSMLVPAWPAILLVAYLNPVGELAFAAVGYTVSKERHGKTARNRQGQTQLKRQRPCRA